MKLGNSGIGRLLSTLTSHEYFEQLTAERQLPLARIRQLIRKHWPKAKEDMSYGMPTYHLGGQPVFALASQKNHITFYVMPYDLLNAFKHDLRTRNCGKSCIRFKRAEQLPPATVIKLVKARLASGGGGC